MSTSEATRTSRAAGPSAAAPCSRARPVQIPDVLADPEYTLLEGQRGRGVSVPRSGRAAAAARGTVPSACSC